MTQRHELTDAQWARLAPLLPPQKPQRGRPARDHRQMVNAMLWIHATGAPWRDLPERYGPWQSVATRFYRWVAAGIWNAILAALQRQGDADGQLDWSAHYVDGTVIRAHQHAAGGGKPMTLALTPGQRNEATMFEYLLAYKACFETAAGAEYLSPLACVEFAEVLRRRS